MRVNSSPRSALSGAGYSSGLVTYIRCISSYKDSQNNFSYLNINLACLFVCLYPINVKTAEPIEPNFFVGHLGTPGKVYEWSKFQIFVSIKIRSSLNFWKFSKIHEIFCENPRIIFVLFYDVHKENMFTINIEDGREAPSKASSSKNHVVCPKYCC